MPTQLSINPRVLTGLFAIAFGVRDVVESVIHLAALFGWFRTTDTITAAQRALLDRLRESLDVAVSDAARIEANVTSSRPSAVPGRRNSAA